MPQILSVDYGLVRTGLAHADTDYPIAFPMETVETSKLRSYLMTYLLKNDVNTLVIGLPLTLNGNMNPIENNIQHFILWLNEKYPQLPIMRIDERFSSKIAQQTIAKSGIGKIKRQNKSLVDKVSASILLESYLCQNFS